MPQEKKNQRTDASVNNTETGTQSTNARVNPAAKHRSSGLGRLARQRVLESCRESVLNDVGLPACWARWMYREVVAQH